MKQRGLYKATCRPNSTQQDKPYDARLRDIAFYVVADNFGEAGMLAQAVYKDGVRGAFSEYVLCEVELDEQVWES